MGELVRAPALAALLAVIVASGWFVAPVAAGDHGPDGRDRRGDRGDDRANDHHGDGDGNSYGAEGSNSSLALEVRASGPVGSGFGSIACTGTPTRHECDKEGGLQGGPASVDYHGNNSAAVPDRTGGGGDTFTVTVGNRSSTFSFDCEMTRETVTNGTACTVGSSLPVGGGAIP